MRFFLMFGLCLGSMCTSAQMSNAHRQYINKEITYINESIHGLLVAHRLFESNNQEINKFVDLPSYTVNHFDNDDLPPNIFQDTKKWFYEKSPQQLYNELLVDNRRGTEPLNSWHLISEMRSLTKFVNNDRLILGQTVAEGRLNQLANIQKAFAYLENGESYYADYAKNVEEFEALLLPHYHTVSLPANRKQVYTALVELHYDVKLALRMLKKNNRNGIQEILPKISRETKWYEICVNELQDIAERDSLLKTIQSIDQIVSGLESFSIGEPSPEEYSMYGPGYYYYNVKILTFLNRYGNGYVSEINAFFDRFGWAVFKLCEEPHYINVIYPEKIPIESIGQNREPKKIIETEDSIENAVLEEPPLAQDPQIDIPPPPEAPPPRPIVVKNTYTIRVDSTVFDLELFDHRIKDGDLVSISVNGEWLFKNISLEKQGRILRLTIDPNLENSVLIRAENIGWRPPNTIGIRYVSNGVAENFFMVTDLTYYEAIEIKYQLR